jgi:hypothetical protein
MPLPLQVMQCDVFLFPPRSREAVLKSKEAANDFRLVFDSCKTSNAQCTLKSCGSTFNDEDSGVLSAYRKFWCRVWGGFRCRDFNAVDFIIKRAMGKPRRCQTMVMTWSAIGSVASS